MKATKPTKKSIFSVVPIEELMSEMMTIEGLFVMMVRYLGIEMVEEDEKSKIVISNNVQPLLAKFVILVYEICQIACH